MVTPAKDGGNGQKQDNTQKTHVQAVRWPPEEVLLDMMIIGGLILCDKKRALAIARKIGQLAYDTISAAMGEEKATQLARQRGQKIIEAASHDDMDWGY